MSRKPASPILRALFRMALLVVIATFATQATMADPPPYPRYKITNNTPWAMNGTWTANYLPMGGLLPSQFKSIQLSGTLQPNQSMERSFPDRIPHLSGNPSYPSAHLRMTQTWMDIGGTRATIDPYVNNSDIVVSPGDSGRLYGKYGSSTIRFSCDGGSGSATSQDYMDCRITQ